MPVYEVYCHVCELTKSILDSHEDAKYHRCTTCGARTTLLMSKPILRGLDTPKYHGRVLTTDDPGFQAEWDSIADEN